MVVQGRQDAVTELRSQITSGLVGGSAETLVRLVPSAADDDELLHELVIGLPADTFGRIAELNPEVAALLVDEFAARALSAQWAFEYTDRIGDTCARLFGATSDANLKATLLATALHIGVHYNRFHVMDVTASLLQSQLTGAQAVTILATLEPIRYNLVVVSDIVNRARVHPVLLSLIACRRT